VGDCLCGARCVLVELIPVDHRVVVVDNRLVIDRHDHIHDRHRHIDDWRLIDDRHRLIDIDEQRHLDEHRHARRPAASTDARLQACSTDARLSMQWRAARARRTKQHASQRVRRVPRQQRLHREGRRQLSAARRQHVQRRAASRVPVSGSRVRRWNLRRTRHRSAAFDAAAAVESAHERISRGRWL
jgi:hypothetical protein